MEEEAAERILSARRSAVDPDARDVVERIFRRDRLVPEDAIGEAGVAEILPGDVVECLRSIRRAHAVNLHDDEPELGLRLHLVVGEERLRHERALRPRVDVLDDGILLRRVETAWPDDDAPDAGRAIASYGDEHLQRLPPRL